MSVSVACGLALLLAAQLAAQSARPVTATAISGIHTHLAMFNDENECGVGAVVPWAGRLWAVTYAPHVPRGSSDKLSEIDVVTLEVRELFADEQQKNDERVVELAHDADRTGQFTFSADLCGDGRRPTVRRFDVPAGEPLRHEFPRAWSAYWLRFAVDTGCCATAQLEYR